VVIRATYQYLASRYVDRSYMPGLLRLMIRFLALKLEWKLITYLLVDAIRRTPSLSERDAKALVTYAISLSLKSSNGKSDIQDCI
jgi:hypothetical protein